VREKEKGMTRGRPVLETKHVTVAYDGLVAVNRVSFAARRGDIVAVIGANGAGKTTLLRLISGLLPATEGEVWFKGQRVDGMAPHRIAALGVTQLFQDVQLFLNMSVVDNVMAGCHVWSGGSLVSTGLRLARARAEEQKMMARAMSQLSLVGLEDRASASPDSLSWGEQKLLGMARALAAGPQLLLLDEPYGGLMPDEIDKLSLLLRNVQHRGVTVLMVEHLTDVVMGIANRVIVLHYGEKIAEGTPAEVQGNEQVIATYLGTEPGQGTSG
jgi:ABC-type branched-subunit amino acid transport system ATPase component